MDQLTHRLPPNFVWPTKGHPGRVPLWALVPTPKQPRQHFDESELDSLAETMKPENGGQQREILTVRALTAEELVLWAPARYMIKSGERRWRSACRAGLPDIEIRVKQYASLGEEKLDTFMLNEGRVGLSDLENAEAIADLMLELDLKTQEQLAHRIGKDQIWVSQHLALLKLSPKARALMSPKILKTERLKREVGVFLSRLSIETQDDLAERMPKGRTPASQQIRWMKDELTKMGVDLPTRKFRPSILRQVVGYFATQVERRAGELLAIEGSDRLFENATPEQVLELLGRIKDAQAELGELVERIEALSIPAAPPAKTVQPVKTEAKAVPVPTSQAAPTVNGGSAANLERMKTLGGKVNGAAKPMAKASEKPATPQHKPAVAQPLAKTATSTQASPAYVPKARRVAAAPSVLGAGKKEKAITFYSERVGRLVTDKVTQNRYITLFDQGYLGFQYKGTDKPDFMPSREEASTCWDEFAT